MNWKTTGIGILLILILCWVLVPSDGGNGGLWAWIFRPPAATIVKQQEKLQRREFTDSRNSPSEFELTLADFPVGQWVTAFENLSTKAVNWHVFTDALVLTNLYRWNHNPLLVKTNIFTSIPVKVNTGESTPDFVWSLDGVKAIEVMILPGQKLPDMFRMRVWKVE